MNIIFKVQRAQGEQMSYYVTHDADLSHTKTHTLGHKIDDSTIDQTSKQSMMVLQSLSSGVRCDPRSKEVADLDTLAGSAAQQIHSLMCPIQSQNNLR